MHSFFKWYHISGIIWYPSWVSKIKEINLTVRMNSLVATQLDRSKICHPIFDLPTVTVPDKWLIIYRSECQCSHRWYSDGHDGQNCGLHPLFGVFSDAAFGHITVESSKMELLTTV